MARAPAWWTSLHRGWPCGLVGPAGRLWVLALPDSEGKEAQGVRLDKQSLHLIRRLLRSCFPSCSARS